ncbi:MAG: LytTR family DNA-binding domain-containing protein [Streptococcus hyointestinalis]|uniref:LytTR family DNA-binding domain-containing protein n=1 Tax=Streptococcus hyointestinalis TaxID=1337 RepID=UPI0023F4AB8E|nr:LytTR family DNA-binding domain-containing protein [Streptococcus hyointestinalis]MCI6871428.1 LytTR family transcriptional regulator [Streptococcus hyointestinalis]MDD6385369.1 LytTR family DNA-binding domain-containing protein [Streptococcus hyointestinalis]MDD7355533.1 LytTR family DNA-binding domain-containing protein [Streptococcus hyointestinalis]MDY4553521.1 LytTR family DNA-binding domain-containing protein [Streptococcus hyointestinalis]
MEVRAAIAKQEKEEVVIYAHQLDEEVETLQKSIKELITPQLLSVKKKREQYKVQQKAVVRIYRENRKLIIDTLDGYFESHQALRDMKRILSPDFIQISQSELINRRHVQRVKITKTGLVELRLVGERTSYSSRRYLKILKEAL